MGLFKQIFFLILLLNTSKVFNQTWKVLSIDSLAGQFIKNLRTDKRVKLFVQTDKWFYVAGEEMRFRAFCINDLSHRISRETKTVYVDLVNDRDSVISQLLLDNEQLKLDGYILLPARLNEGYYWLRAYTRTRLRTSNESIALMKYYPKGYCNAPAFASPDYSKNEIKNSGYPDKRSTLYWNGNIRTDRNGKASVNFFTDDSKSTYTVTVEGITAIGILLYKKVKINRH